jgi:polyisoprenoid-binding protein YceI
VSSTINAIEIPGYVAGKWTIDPVHSDVSFKVRHLVVANVRGKFHGVIGTIVLAENPLESSVLAEIDLASIDTGNEERDGDLRSARFFDVERYPTMTYRSKAVRPEGGVFVIEGELNLRGVTRDVDLHVELNGFANDPWGSTRVGFTATAVIKRHEFGIGSELPSGGGGAVVGENVQVLIEIEAVLVQSETEGLSS